MIQSRSPPFDKKLPRCRKLFACKASGISEAFKKDENRGKLRKSSHRESQRTQRGATAPGVMRPFGPLADKKDYMGVHPPGSNTPCLGDSAMKHEKHYPEFPARGDERVNARL